MPSLILARHAQPLIAPGVCYGQLDLPADPQATATCAEQLARVLPKNTSVVTSPLQRCEQLTTVLIGLRPDLAVKTDYRLQEMHFGHWEGQPWADIARAELDGWTADFAHYPAGGNGESATKFMTRVAAAFDELDPTKDTLWVTHAGVIRAATLIAKGIRHISQASEWPTEAPAYGQWCKLVLTTISQEDQSNQGKNT